jgi:hypothetical protein
MGNVGRPPAFETPEQLQDSIDEYLKDNKIPTVSGLAYYLGFESRQSFYDYEQKPEFTYTVRKARLFMESHYEERLQGNNPTGSIFWLKNAGWKDKQEVEQSGGTSITVKWDQSLIPNTPTESPPQE